MKKYIFGLALLAGGLFTSCDKDNIGTIYETTAQNISFLESKASVVTKANSASVTITLTRSKTTSEYAAHYTLTTSDGGIFTDKNSGTATFAAGEWSTTITIDAANMQGGTLYTCQLQLSSEDAASADIELGTETITTIDVSVMCDYNWVAFGTGFFSSPEIMEAEYDVVIEKAEGTNRYKALSLYEPGYDVQFIIESDNSVIVEPQPGWYYSGYGDVYVNGALSDDGSNVAGYYDPATKTISLTMEHILPAADDYSFGIFTDTLVMP